jgi:hypothetical protein
MRRCRSELEMKDGMSEEDWELVNAYSDGELSQRDRRVFEQRLKSEPDLASALNCVRDVSRSLAPLHPRTVYETGKRPRAPWKWAASGLIAASILGAVIAATLETRAGATKIHSAFLDQTFAGVADDLHRVARGTVFPDLGLANLTFVAARETDLGTAVHYAGQRGCRLTFLIMDEPVRPALNRDTQLYQWDVAGKYFAILATGMDAGKFSAIAEYLKQKTRETARPATDLALRDATQSASRCT